MPLNLNPTVKPQSHSRIWLHIEECPVSLWIWLEAFKVIPLFIRKVEMRVGHKGRSALTLKIGM